MERRRLQLGRLSGQLHALSPLATMARGYVVATSPAGRVVTSVAAIAPGDLLQLRLRDGAAETRVETVRRIEDPTDGQG